MSDRLDDVEAIKQLKARYFRLLDTKDWDGFRGVFTDDVVIDTSQAGGDVVSGVDAFLDFLQVALADTTTVHQGHMPEIDVTDAGEASGTWALHDIVIWADGTRLDGFGHYHERYRRQPDGWRIASSTLTRLHTDIRTEVNG
jgi:ketosteroid isomerase-like protein